jgi:hypothetical protein
MPHGSGLIIHGLNAFLMLMVGWAWFEMVQIKNSWEPMAHLESLSTQWPSRTHPQVSDAPAPSAAALPEFQSQNVKEQTMAPVSQPEPVPTKAAPSPKHPTPPPIGAQSPEPAALPHAESAVAATAKIPTVPDSPHEVKFFDVTIGAKQLQATGDSRFDASTQELIIPSKGSGFRHKTQLQKPNTQGATYQLWITHFVEGPKGEILIEVNGVKHRQKLLDMGLGKVSKVFTSAGKAINLKRHSSKVKPYYFRDYCGEYSAPDAFELSVSYEHHQSIKLVQVEWIKVERYRPELESFLHSYIDFYNLGYVENGLVRSTYRQDKGQFERVSSTAVCGIALTAFAMNHTLGRDPKAEQKALTLLKTINHKNPKSKVRLERHSSGLFRHFVNAHNGIGKSEFSTIDTSILISGALVARNTFQNSEIKALADELWNSIHWDRFVIKTDPSNPRFYLTAEQMDDPNNTKSIGMYNEYILLAYYCQLYENFKYGDRARKHIMPDLFQLPRLVYENRLMVANHIQPSFLVQFPYYMSSLCEEHLFVSYTAAQGLSDRQHGLHRFGLPEAWGVSPGNTPTQGYEVTGFIHNAEGVVGPRMVAGFMSVVPDAVDDYLSMIANPERHLNTPFGVLLPRYVPGESWKPFRFAAVDFSSGLYGLASMHPKLGMKWLKEKNRFTFRQRKYNSSMP